MQMPVVCKCMGLHRVCIKGPDMTRAHRHYKNKPFYLNGSSFLKKKSISNSLIPKGYSMPSFLVKCRQLYL